MICHGDCLEELKKLKDNSVDSLVTDPPAGISFMGKEWDHHKGGRVEWIEWMSTVMKECMRVMKPGAHGLVWSLPRTSHWTATALEDAGFEIRDNIYHLFGSGFPKSLDVSKAIDKEAGKVGPIIGKNPAFRPRQLEHNAKWETAMRPENKHGPATDDAKQWQGFGTALKPAVETWWLIRKPLSEKTVAKNVLKWSTGALNIDGSRIEGLSTKELNRTPQRGKAKRGSVGDFGINKKEQNLSMFNPQGRFPSHLLLSHSEFCEDDRCDMFCPVAMLDRQSGNTGNGFRVNPSTQSGSKFQGNKGVGSRGHNDSGGASRFFYCAKVSSSERGKDNGHPTVKAQKLMRYLINLITPPNGTVLDPFMGSGSTGLAAKTLGFKFIGIEKEKEYLEIAERRIAL